MPVAGEVVGIKDSRHFLARVAAGDSRFLVYRFGIGVKRLKLQSVGASVPQRNLQGIVVGVRAPLVCREGGVERVRAILLQSFARTLDGIAEKP